MGAADDIVELIEEHALPGFLDPRRLRWPAQERGDGVRPLSIREQRLQAAVPLLDGDARAVTALKDRIEIPLDRKSVV